MFNRIRRDRQARTRRSVSNRLGFDMLEDRQLLTAVIYDPIGTFSPTVAHIQTNTITIQNPFPIAETIDMDVIPDGSGRGTLSKTSFPLTASGTGSHTTDVFTPTALSSAADDIEVTETVHGQFLPFQVLFYTATQVEFSEDIKNSDTPTYEEDRIPPRTNTDVAVTVSPDLTGSPDGDSLYLSIQNQSANNGYANIDGADLTLQIEATTTIALSGAVDPSTQAAYQTVPGHAGALKLAVANTPTGSGFMLSNGFSVAAIPTSVEEQYYQDSSLDINHHGDPGLQDTVYFESDSGNNSDLNDISVQEHVLVTAYSSPFTSGIIDNPNYISLDTTDVTGQAYIYDFDFFPQTSWTGVGSQTVVQLYTFDDSRTASTGVTVADSGFTWTISVVYVSGAYELNVDKTAAAESFLTYSTGAASVYDPTSPPGHINHTYPS